jgi:hypothetical protein
MTRPNPRADFDALTRAARAAWDAVPAYLRRSVRQEPWGETRVEFSERRAT